MSKREHIQIFQLAVHKHMIDRAKNFIYLSKYLFIWGGIRDRSLRMLQFRLKIIAPIASYAQVFHVFPIKVKVKVKVAFWSFFNTKAIWPIVFLLPTSSRVHLQRRHASYRCGRPLPAKAGTITNEFC